MGVQRSFILSAEEVRKNSRRRYYSIQALTDEHRHFETEIGVRNRMRKRTRVGSQPFRAKHGKSSVGPESSCCP